MLSHHRSHEMHYINTTPTQAEGTGHLIHCLLSYTVLYCDPSTITQISISPIDIIAQILGNVLSAINKQQILQTSYIKEVLHPCTLIIIQWTK